MRGSSTATFSLLPDNCPANPAKMIRMQRALTTVSVLVLSAIAAAQEPVTIPLHFEKKLEGNSHGFVPMFEYGRDGVVTHAGSEHRIVPPELAEETKVAFGYIFFAGRPGAIERGILFMVEGYEGDAPRFFVDLNNNLDLTDDEPAVEAEGDSGKYLLTLVSDRGPDHTFTVRLGFFRDMPKIREDPSLADRYESLLAGMVQHNGGTAVPAGHWMFDQRLNVRSASAKVADVSFQIGVFDWDCNGAYTDPKDMVVVGDYQAEFLPRDKASGATLLTDETLIELGDQVFEVVEVDPAGSFIRIAKSDKELNRLRDGSMLPDMPLTMFDGSTSSLHSFLQPGKLLLIDFWGHWCGGCIQAIPGLVETADTWKDDLTILGIHFGDHDEARKLIEKHGMTWAQAEVTDELKEAFLVDQWPYYVLVDGDGTIGKLGIRLAQAEQVVQGKAAEKADK